ncbi:hypothetical protein ACT4S2_03900 [Kocuria turfanensis]|uniref:hypothetical protein n=1 Tax=Kocuria turfanensis TaxID=388357 RepID=UPI0040354ED5
MDPLRKTLAGTALAALLLGGAATSAAAGSDEDDGADHGSAYDGRYDYGDKNGYRDRDRDDHGEDDGRWYGYHRSGPDDRGHDHDRDHHDGNWDGGYRDGGYRDGDGTNAGEDREDHWYYCEQHDLWHWVDHGDEESRAHHDRMDDVGKHQHEKGRDHHHGHQR